MPLKKDTTSECVLQSQIFQWHWNNCPDERGLLFHCQQKARNKIEGNRFKAMGVIPGVSDLIYLKPGGKPIFIELKIDTGIQSPIQKEWEIAITSAGYDYVICRSLETFKTIIQ